MPDETSELLSSETYERAFTKVMTRTATRGDDA